MTPREQAEQWITTRSLPIGLAEWILNVVSLLTAAEERLQNVKDNEARIREHYLAQNADLRAHATAAEGERDRLQKVNEFLITEVQKNGPLALDLMAERHLREQAERLAERLKQEARGHAMEARTQRQTVYECYQAVGAQVGDWHGVEPIRQYVATAKSGREQAEQALETLLVHAQAFYDAISKRHHGRMPLEVEESYTRLAALLGGPVQQTATKTDDDLARVDESNCLTASGNDRGEERGDS